jgi:MinD-like ATPase involved in chromosome partitioning or flagellar assembly
VKSIIAVLTTRAGQTSTHWAVSVAWTLSESRRVLLVDCDMEGGTVADLLYLDVGDRGIANCFGEGTAPASLLEAQAVAVPGNADMRVVPGLRGAYGYDMGECLRQLSGALRDVDTDVVIADLGHPLGHTGLRSPRAVSEAIGRTFQRVFVVVRDEPALLARSIEVLRAARLGRGELVVCAQRSAAYARTIAATLEQELPDLRLRNGWRWDERRAARMADTGRPMLLTDTVAELCL